MFLGRTGGGDRRRPLEVGRIGRAHGLRGEISVTLTSDRSERLAPGSVLTTDDRELVVRAARPHQHRWLVTLRRHRRPHRGRAAAGRRRSTPTRCRPRATSSGCTSSSARRCRTADGNALGVVEAIEANPASDLLVLDGERLVPLTFVVAHEPGLVTVDVPDGLWD